MLMVPVGAIVVLVELRIGLGPSFPSGPYSESSQSRKLPLSAASCSDAPEAFSSMNLMICSPRSNALCESYGIPRRMSVSAQPMTPRPIRRMLVDVSAISGDRVFVHGDHVVQEPDRGLDHGSQPVPVHTGPILCLHHELGQVNRPQVAGVV